MIGAILAFAPMLLKFVGEGVLQRHYDAKIEMAKSANASEKAKLDAEVRRLGHEVERRKLQRDLQLKEMEQPWLYFPKALLMYAVGIYASAIIFSSLFSLKTRFGLTIEDLPPRMWNVVMLVIAYWFLDKAARHFRK